MENPGAVLVTGATSGIGRAVCEVFGSRGYAVYAHARDEGRGGALVEHLRSRGSSAELLLADLAEPSGPAALMDQARRLPARLTAVVNNAGGVFEQVFTAGQVESPVETFQVNVFAAYELTVLAAELMESGAIVNVSSIHAHTTLGARLPHYSAAKAALSHLTQLLAVELAPKVRVNAVSPGRTRTEAWGTPTADQDAALVADLLIERWIEPAEIAEAVWFLVRNGACTGTDLVVDGGIGLKAVGART